MKKGIYCLENMWSPSVKDKLTVQPILELLEKADICPHIYHKCATKEELIFMIKKWRLQAVQRKFPILYFAFHGSSESISLGNNEELTMSELGELLEDNCSGKVFFFASCETMDMHGRKIQSLLEKTGAIAAIGYKVEVDWMTATAFELLVLNALQQDEFDTKGIENIKSKIQNEYGKLHSILKFSMVVNNRIHFPRV